jgi:hypothetical protein
LKDEELSQEIVKFYPGFIDCLLSYRRKQMNMNYSLMLSLAKLIFESPSMVLSD